MRVSEAWLDAHSRESMPERQPTKAHAIHRKLRPVANMNRRSTDSHARHQRVLRERAAVASGDPRTTANWVTGDLLGALKGREITESPVVAGAVGGELVGLIGKGEISGKLAKEIFAKMNREAANRHVVIIDREGLRQISDTGALEKIIDEVIAASPKQVEQYNSGKTTVIGYLVGQVMKVSKGQANPAAVNELLKAKLG